MTDTMQRLVIVVREHPHKGLSPNASASASIGAKRARQRLVKAAREAGYAAAVDTVNGQDWAGLMWMVGKPVNVDIVIGWGVGSGTKDDDNAIAMCKPYRDGIADAFQGSDRRWRTRRVVQARAAPDNPFGQVSFAFTPREDHE